MTAVERHDRGVYAAVAEQGERRLLDRIAETAAGLRKVADEIERDAVRYADGPTSIRKRTPLSHLTSRVVHRVTWGVANLGLDLLGDDAAEADAYRALADEPGAIDRDVLTRAVEDVVRDAVARAGFAFSTVEDLPGALADVVANLGGTTPRDV